MSHTFATIAHNASEAAYPNLQRGLVGAWVPSLGVTGDTLRDVSGRAPNGQLTNMDPATDWQVSGGGWCLDFDGSNDYVQVSNFGQILTSHATVHIRFKADVNNYAHKAITFPHSATSWTAPFYAWNLGIYEQKLFAAYAVDGNWQTGVLQLGSTAQTNRWYTLCGVFSRGVITMYVDGVQAAVKDISGSGTSIYYGTNQGITFGADAPYFVAEQLNGQIAETFVYDRALSPAEIKQIYLRPSSPIERRRRRVYSVPAGAIVYARRLSRHRNIIGGGLR